MPEITKSSSSVPITAGAIALPAVGGLTAQMLTSLTGALGVPRNVLAADDQIEHARSNLPRLLARIPPEHRTERLLDDSSVPTPARPAYEEWLKVPV